MKKYNVILSIAGFDPSGGAGILADAKTASLCGCYATGVVTAVTAQNTAEVVFYDYVGDDMLRMQLDTLLSDITPDAVKIGMLPTRSSIEIVAETIRKFNLKNVVVDPVLISTSGTPLENNPVDAIDARKEILFPLCTLVTPNIPEYKALQINPNISSTPILLKGGHYECEEQCIDVLYRKGMPPIKYSSARISSHNTHGTGCVLSSAIASFLASGFSLTEAIGKAKLFISNAISRGTPYKLGSGHGPLFLLNQSIENTELCI